jgi:hypothetical protein
MKRILPIIIAGIFILSGLGASAFQSMNIRPFSETTEPQEYYASETPKDYTHTVLVEVGTATWCPSCPASNSAWHNIYVGGNYDFEYCELVIDKNSVANAHMNNYNLYWVPTSYFDGGQFVYPGTSYTDFYNNLDASGSRTVPDLEATLDVEWIDNAKIDIDLSIKNNEVEAYPGTLRVYIIELESSLWNDYGGSPYYHAFLDFAINEDINIAAGSTYTDSVLWDGAANGYPGISENNIQVILAVFDDTAHQAYSDPPSGAPFSAYYVDEVVAKKLSGGGTNDPPNPPEIDGPSNGVMDVEYEFTFNSEDPNEDDVYIYILWGDGYVDTTSTVPSGTDVIASHTYTKEKTFTIEAKAIDSNGDESDLAEFEITIPRNRQSNYLFINHLIKQYPNLYLIVKQLFRL